MSSEPIVPPAASSPSPSPGPPSPGAAPPAASRAQSAGRGLVLITGAKLWFMVGGALLTFLLPRFLPTQASYGQWSNVLSWVSPFNNVIVTATIQAVARFAARGGEWVEGTKRTALRLQLFVGGGIGLGYFLAAPIIAGAELDPSLTTPLRLSAGVIVIYSVYAVFVGAANGAREFHKQASLDATFTTLRTVLVCGGALALGSVTGAVGGFVAAAAVVMTISLAVIGLRPMGDGARRPAVGDMLAFMLPVAAYLFVTNELMFIDGQLLKRLVTEWATSGGARDPARVADEAVAIYSAAQQLARIPYQAILSVTFVLFPLVSQATFAADIAKTRLYIAKALRLSFLVVLALATGIAAHPTGLLALFPKNQYLPGAAALTILAFGYVGFSLLSIVGTILNGAGRAAPATLIALATLTTDVVLAYASMKWALAHNRDPLQAAAIATTASITVGVLVSLTYLRRSFGAALPLATLARGAVAAGAGILAGRLVPLQGKAGILGCVVGGLVYLVVIGALREITVGELKGFTRRT